MPVTDQAMIRNFCIIAHIDHGKSTLADRMLEVTGVIEKRDMRAQYLDRMDIERERGITIKAQAVRLPWTALDEKTYTLNLIDTPGHVDFTYEVSRSLAACEGAVLLVDAAQGIEAQTLANLYLAVEAGLHVIPVLNKIDLPAAQPEKFAAEIAGDHRLRPVRRAADQRQDRRGRPRAAREDRRRGAAPPTGDLDAPPRALVFDSVYDIYRGVITYVRVVDGTLTTHEKCLMMSTGAAHEVLEVGVISPEPKKTNALSAGEVGYVIPGVKNVRAGPRRRHDDQRRQAGRPSRSAATAIRGRWSTAACIRSTATSTPTCVTRSTSCSSTTPRSRTSRRRRRRSASASAAASSACCTWRSSASGSSASSTSR